MLSRLCLSAFTFCFALPVLALETLAQEDTETPPVRLLDFTRDVEGILRTKCLECHGPEEAKNDFRVDDPEWMLSYVEPGDLEGSSLWADYLITDDPDMKMPPPDKPGLTGVEMATLKLWIEEGADWPADAFAATGAEETDAEVAPSQAPKSMATRIWLFQGLFHPASVHFPIALLSVSAFFCFLSFFSRSTFEPAAFHCLWIGALGAVAASLMGWGYAQYEGYGAGYSFDLADSAIDRHRWLGIAVALGAVGLLFVARSVRKSETGARRGLWFFGAIGLLLAVSITGYQGGELTYGEDHYMKEFSRLFPPQESAPSEGSEPTAITETEAEIETENAAVEAASDPAPEQDAPSAADAEA